MAKSENQNLLISIELLKRTLYHALANAVENFERDTGITPRSIDVEFVEVTAHGEQTQRYAVSRVTVGFGL